MVMMLLRRANKQDGETSYGQVKDGDSETLCEGGLK
jgi:hypothetical protein